MERLLIKLHTVTLVKETENLSHASSGAIESGEMSELLKLLGQKTTEEELQKIMDDVDANSDGVIDFPEFLGMMARLTDGVTETSPVKLKKLSHYGRDTLLRWIKDDPEELDGDVTGPGIAPFRAAARRILLHRKPEWSMYVIITLAAIVSGVQTYPRFHDSIAIVIFEHSILVAFTLEIIVKMAGESSGKLYHFFQDGWNVFDFVIVAMLLIMIPFNGADFEGVRLLRLFRAFRLLKATRLLPKLGLVVETIITSASSVVYITLFLMLVAYIYAIIAVSIFRDNDPFHFDNLGIAMLSLFRIATMDDWTDVMYFNMFGCEWGDYGGATGGASCESEKFGLVAAIFFVSVRARPGRLSGFSFSPVNRFL